MRFAYTLLVVYASLHPFTGWRDTGVELTAFLAAPWPRYWTGFDLGVNFLAYLPLGLLWVSALPQRWPRGAAVLAAALIGAGLSLLMETLQNFLPARVPSNLDLASNALGALAGALIGVRRGRLLHDGGALHRWRSRLIIGGGQGDVGLTLLGLWLFTQLTPVTLLFGNGDIRGLLDLAGAMDYAAEEFGGIEAAIVAANTLAVATLASCLLRGETEPGPRAQLRVLALLGVALLIKSFSLALSLSPAASFSWLTEGALAGLCVGCALWFAVSFFPLRMRQAVAALALLLATVLVNLAPDNPYLDITWQGWNPGQLLNFFGLTHWAASLWPFIALPWLMLLRVEPQEKL